ncbi:MAG: quinol dehydrogenase ferredoxin subunit NapH [Nitrospirota bacterium]
MSMLMQNRYRIMRRVVQISVLSLFVAGNGAGWGVLEGDLSSSLVFGTVPLSDPFALIQVLATGTMVAGQALLGGGIVLLFFAVIAGRAFCGWICPVNMVTDLADTVSTAAAGGTRLLRMSRNIRYWVLGLSLALSALLGIAAFEWISPIGALHRGVIYGMGWGWTSIAAVFLFDALVVRNGFCGHACPLGAFYSLAGGKSAMRVIHNAERCSRCMRCVESCPEPQVLPMVGKSDGAVTSGECTNCGRCIEVCPDRAMRFGIRAHMIERGPKEVAS